MPIRVFAALLAAALSLPSPARAASLEGPAPVGEWARSLGTYFAAPSPDFELVRGIPAGLRALDPADPALKGLAAQVQAAAQRLLDAPVAARATQADLLAASHKFTVLNDPAFRNLLTPDQQRRVGAAFWAYNTHLFKDVRADVWEPADLTLAQKIEGIAKALEASRVADPAEAAPALRRDAAVKFEVFAGDAAAVKADALVSAVELSGFCRGGINALIEKRGASGFRRQVEAAKPLADGRTLIARGGAENKALFRNVAFVADDIRMPLHQLVLKGLRAAADAGFKTVTLPALRTGWNFGLIEKTYEQVVAETIKGVNLFLEAGRKSVESISLIVHNNPRLLSLFQAVEPADPEREALRRAELSGRGFRMTPRPKKVSLRRLNSPVVRDLLAPWDLSRMLIRRKPLEIGKVAARGAFSKPSVSVLNLPIKMPGTDFRIPAELEQYREFLQKIVDDQAAVNPRLEDFYAYLTVDSGYVKKGDFHRRPGVHIDGVQGSRYAEKMPPENTYSASDAVGTVFYAQSFDLRHVDPDRDYIHGELERQADESNAVQTEDYGIYHWDSYSAHRAAVASQDTPRTFVRVEFSRKVYDAVGDTINPLFNYDWKRVARPIPYELNWHAEPLAKVVHEKGRRANAVAVKFIAGTAPDEKKKVLKRAKARRRQDVAPIARALAQEPSVAEITISDKIAPLWDLVRDYPALDGRVAFPELGRPLDDWAIVEGSRKGGGNQPDFLIDHSDPDLRGRILEPARAIGSRKTDDWTKLRELQALVNRALPIDGWNAPRYESFIASIGGAARVSLGDYLRLGIGVCRENALLTVAALRAAGYKARFAYFKVFKDDGVVDQDHGVALVELGGTTYVLDSYRPLGRYYNGHRMIDLLQPPADGKYPFASPLAAANASGPGRWRFVLNPFPRLRSSR